ncbi:DNA-binding transcriptional ArsR family regulator [Arthrobacter sp. JUb119]|nr:DNA-binding transcriptional ArsR family regulator [Arthrobacter sp. JUb119]TDU19194.1 ArsR family transcriptional regulator [Arthrobacter sp. JUb115]
MTYHLYNVDYIGDKYTTSKSFDPPLYFQPIPGVTYNQMVVYELSEEQANKVFRALADATRRDIVRRTLNAEVSVSEIAASYDMSFAAVQKHVAALESAGLVTKIARGRERIVRGQPDTIRHAQELLSSLEDIWRQRISRLDDFLADGDK